MSQPLKRDPTRQADITLVCGQSGSGKSLYVKSKLRDVQRAVAWDVKGEYQAQGFRSFDKLQPMIAEMLKSSTGKFAYVPTSMSHFDLWCKAAHHWGACTVIAEELADVTSPGKAPEGWGWILRRGREHLTVYGITQRPAESDKTIMGLVTRIHCCRLQRFNDRKYMAQELDLPVEQLNTLSLERREYLEKHMVTGEILRGFQPLPGKKAARVA